ncbi:hypothetical protein AHAS_Ahas05G0088200 [Arachis hypogaea]
MNDKATRGREKSSEEEDLIDRSIKKSKLNRDEIIPDADQSTKETTEATEKKTTWADKVKTITNPLESTTIPGSYRDKLMQGDTKMELPPDEIIQMVIHDYDHEDWKENSKEGSTPFNQAEEGDYRHALLEEPWQMANHYLLVQRAVSKIGTMLKIDQNTSIRSRGKFAWLCVEVDLQRQLVLAIQVLGREFKIEYEGLHMIYFGCGKYGHRQELCPDKRDENVVMPVVATTTETNSTTLMDKEGFDLAGIPQTESFQTQSGAINAESNPLISRQTNGEGKRNDALFLGLG